MTNVQISKYSDFNKKRFLVVDDFPEFRTAIKRMVEAFGGSDIDTASNGEDAIAKIKSKNYHAILCDYNLGDGKDGQQVLEEGKYSGAINESQIFLLLTAENTAEMVMGALEYEPDDYLVKPFNKEMVHNRLMKSINKKRELMGVYDAMADKNPEQAIKVCEEKIAAGGKLALPCLKIKGKILFDNKQYDKAIELYEKLLEAKKLPWILMGLGKTHFMQGQYEKAKEYFEQIVELSAVNVEGYDWIAKTEIKLGKLEDAQKTLEKAVKLSSKAILRQQALGDVAYNNQDLEVAEKAYRNAVTLGKFSCYRREQDYLKYAELLLSKCKDQENGKISIKAGNDAIYALETLSNIYRDDKKIQAQVCTMMSLAMHAVNRPDNGKVMSRKAIDYIEKYNVEMEPSMMLKLGEALVMSKIEEKGEDLIKKYKQA